jgi:hypothetical protein
MPLFEFQCPRTGITVQGFVSDVVTSDEHFVSQACLSCGRSHLVHPKSGKVRDEEPGPRPGESR